MCYKLADALATWRTPAGDVLDRKGKSNVKVLGLAREDVRAVLIVMIERLLTDDG